MDKFTWLYIGSQDLWAVFAIVLYFSKYADIKLGKPHEKPEFNDVTWFVMLFACGIGVGLFFYGVAEPVYHYVKPNRYSADSTMPDNTVAQIAINLTLYHWGIHGWIVYCLLGLLLALMAYRENLPMTMKSCFYPLLGDRIFGWPGDAIDTISGKASEQLMFESPNLSMLFFHCSDDYTVWSLHQSWTWNQAT